MVRTTPPRPADVVALFPELAPLARTAVRLHPRPGEPTVADSSIGGPLLWPAGEPWPTCAEHAGPTEEGYRPDDVRLYRKALIKMWNQPEADSGDPLTAQERAIVDGIDEGAQIAQDGPVPMVPVAQIYAADVPALPRPPGTDLLQVLWCPFEHEDDQYAPTTVLRWRAADGVTNSIQAAPQPSVIGEEGLLPQPCVLHPETVTEYPAPHELPEDLADRIHAWEEDHDVVYQYDLAVAPGCKIAGHAPWSFSDPFPMPCDECGSNVQPLLTIDPGEWDGGSKSWQPIEDADNDAYPANSPTMLTIGRDARLQLYICPTSFTHPHVQNVQ